MGKHKKFLKSEKAKVKLKGNKLKAAQNVTKTDFKVRKIVLTEQLKNVQKLETGERKKHNIVDCLARLKNSSSQEAVSNLREIILYQPEDFQKYLEAIIKAAANLSLSIEKNERKDCFKLLDTICSQTSEFILRPFFPILLTYLKCAMTHIKPAIQEDSLLMFDILLRNAPSLVASERDKILPNFLDLVSKMRTESNPERTLSVQMGNKITNMKWRKNILERLIVYLKCINSSTEKNGKKTIKNDLNVLEISERNEFIDNPYHRLSNIMEITLSSLENNEDSLSLLHKHESTDQIGKYITMIMPLMFETWMEIKPANETNNINSISQENALILKIIMDIQLELFNMMKDNVNLQNQFLKKYQDSFDKQIMHHFPYIQNTEGGKRSQESGGEKCIYQNISIAIMYLHFSVKNQQRFTKYREKCFNFLEDIISMWKNKDAEFNSLMKRFIRILFSQDSMKIFGNDSKRIFNALVRKCNVDQSSFDPKLALVCEIFEKNKDLRLSESDKLLSQMVHVLSENEFVPIYLIKTISLLARKGNRAVLESIDKLAINIVKNLQNKLKVSGNLEDSDGLNLKMEIANLMYWIQSQEVISKLSEMSKTDPITVKIKQIIAMKLNT